MIRLSLSSCLLIFSLTLGLASSALATFPGVEIALWDPHFAKEDRSNPDYQEIQKFAEQKQYASALEKTNALIQKHPEKGTPRILKALILHEMGKFRQSYFELQRGRAIQPRHPAIHFAHCQVYRNLGEVELADRSCKIAVEQHPESPEAHYEKALTQAAMGHMEEANRELKEASRLDSKNAVYFREMGLNFTYLNQTDQAIKAFKRALAVDPQELESAYQLGYLYAVKKDRKNAETFLNRVYDSRKNHPKVEAARNLIEHLKKNDGVALPAKVDPKSYHRSRSQSLYRAGQYGLSYFEIQTAARLNPNDRNTQQILVGLASLLMRPQVTEKAVRHLMEISKSDKVMQAKSYQELGDMKLLQGEIGKARTYYEKSLELGDPDRLAKISLKELPANGDSPPGVKPLEPFHIYPTDALNRKGEMFAQYGMFERAIAIYSMVLRIDPLNLESKLNTAAAYYNSQQYNRAIALLEKTLVSHPNHTHIVTHRVLLAKAYAKNGDSQDATKHLEAVKKFKPEIVRSLKADPAFQSFKDDKVFK